MRREGDEDLGGGRGGSIVTAIGLGTSNLETLIDLITGLGVEGGGLLARASAQGGVGSSLHLGGGGTDLTGDIKLGIKLTGLGGDGLTELVLLINGIGLLKSLRVVALETVNHAILGVPLLGVGEDGVLEAVTSGDDFGDNAGLGLLLLGSSGGFTGVSVSRVIVLGGG